MNWRILFFSSDERMITDVPVTQAQATALLASDDIPEAEAIGQCFPFHGYLEATDTPDPLVEAERAVVEAACTWCDNGFSPETGLRLNRVVREMRRLRAATGDLR